MDTFLSSMCTSHDNDLMLYILLLSWWVKTKPVDNNKKIALMMCFNNFFIFILWTVTFIVFISSGICIYTSHETYYFRACEWRRWPLNNGLGAMSRMHSSTNVQAPPISVVLLCSCDKVYYKQEVCLLLYLLGQIVTQQYNPNPFD